jgi:hypothetical protein
MESAEEFAESQVRRFLMKLFDARKRRLLKMMADIYSWSPETLAAHEAQFVRMEDTVPAWAER